MDLIKHIWDTWVPHGTYITVFTRWFQLFETMFRPRTWAAMCQNRIPQNKMIYSQKRLSLPPKARYEILTHGKQCMTPTSGLKGSVYFE